MNSIPWRNSDLDAYIFNSSFSSNTIRHINPSIFLEQMPSEQQPYSLQIHTLFPQYRVLQDQSFFLPHRHNSILLRIALNFNTYSDKKREKERTRTVRGGSDHQFPAATSAVGTFVILSRPHLYTLHSFPHDLRAPRRYDF